jgi:uncharacterized phage-associated protein
VRTKVDVQKAIQVLLFVTQRVPDMYHALKVLYFADKEHMAKYGRLIYGDNYVAMSKGPVPSLAYDIVKDARDGRSAVPCIPASEFFSVSGYSITPLQPPDLDQLSESDTECLEAAMKIYGTMPFILLRMKSHEEQAFSEADENDFIPTEAIVRMLPDSDAILDYMVNY